MESKKVQKAGDGSQQIQAESITIINGVTEERVRAIFNEQNQLARKEYTEDAYRIADERVGKFEERFMPRITQVEDALPSFADPAFQLLLRRAQQSAAGTEREADYDLLTELLVCHVQKGQVRKNRAAINRAVEIVGEIDNDALCGLTVAHSLINFRPVTGSVVAGLEVLNSLFCKMIYNELPEGSEWVDHLDILGAVRIVSFGNLRTIREMLFSDVCEYFCAGIKDDSDEYRDALELLDKVHITRSLLIENECLPGYVRLAFRSVEDAEKAGIIVPLRFSIPSGDSIKTNVRVALNDEQKTAIRKIREFYSQDATLLEQVENNFFNKWDSYEYLHRIRQWWSSIPQAFNLTQVGRILAHTNAKRCDPSVPDLL